MPVKRNASVALSSGGGRLALVADTHSAPHPRTSQLLQEMRPDAILHAGDIGALGVLDELSKIAPTLAVRGNIDGVDNDLPDELAIDVSAGELLFRIYLVHIAVYGPKLRADVARRAHADEASIVVCGHSHVPFIGVDRGLTVVNPGSIGPRRFHLPIVFGAMNVNDGKIAFEHVSCETGQRWLP